MGSFRRQYIGLALTTVKLLQVFTILIFWKFQPYTLEVYKSLKEKLALLDCAIKMHDGNAITAVSVLNNIIYYHALILCQASKYKWLPADCPTRGPPRKEPSVRLLLFTPVFAFCSLLGTVETVL